MRNLTPGVFGYALSLRLAGMNMEHVIVRAGFQKGEVGSNGSALYSKGDLTLLLHNGASHFALESKQRVMDLINAAA